MSLAGKRILVLRPAHQAAELAGRIEAMGGLPIVIPAIEVEPAHDFNHIDELLAKLDEFAWLVFTSANGVDVIAPRIATQPANPPKSIGGPGGVAAPFGKDPRAPEGANPPKSIKVAAVGPGTSAALKLHGFTTDWMPSSFDIETLANTLPGTGRVLMVRALSADAEGDEILTRRGFGVERIDAYRTKQVNAVELAEAVTNIDAVAFTSASTVESFRAAIPGEIGAVVCSIGPATSAACARAGLKVGVQAPEHTIPGLVKAMDEYLTN